MGYFLTSKSRIEQLDVNGYWKLIDNELYMDNDGKIYLTPRNFWTDGYSIPQCLLALMGDKNKYDVRPSHGHDVGCRYHERIQVAINLTNLKRMGYLHKHKEKDIIVCEDIPKQFLLIRKVDKTENDNMFYRMMRSVGINKFISAIMRFAVFFNFNWWIKAGKKSLTEYEIYEDDLPTVNGV